MTREAELDLAGERERGGSPKPGGAPSGANDGGTPAAEKKPGSGHALRWIIGFVLIALATGGYLWWQHSEGYESTDDAQIEGHLDNVSSRIGGTVTYINPLVENNKFVEAGTLLLELDARDYEADLAHAKATLGTRSADERSAAVAIPIAHASAFGALRSAEAAKAQAAASVDAESASLVVAQHGLQRDQTLYDRAERDRVRYQALVEKHEISRSEYDARQTDAASAAQAVEADRAAVHAAEQRITQAQSLVTQRQAQIDGTNSAPEQVTSARTKSQAAAGQVAEALADINTAKLNLSYTKIYAPASGIVGRKVVEIGNRVQQGQGLMVIVPVDDIWVTANFKETQMKQMRPGQSVSVHVDAFDRDYSGAVESMPGAAGPLFSLFPPENSSGNYVKVVQRFPVRIRLRKDQDTGQLLRPGMSVEPTVSIR